VVFPQGLGHEARQADRHEEGKGRHRPKDRSHPHCIWVDGTSFDWGQPQLV
jgi:hypothetical protein